MLAAVTLPGMVQSASAQAVNPGTNRLIQQNELQQLRNSLQRQQFQQQQQQYRDQDRRIVPQPRLKCRSSGKLAQFRSSATRLCMFAVDIGRLRFT